MAIASSNAAGAASSGRRIKVLIIDDSALMRGLLREVLSRDPEIEVVGAALDGYTAWSQLQNLKPDVLTLDVEMPGMSGLEFLEKVMQTHPLPVVMVSSLTTRGGATTLRALELGAVDYAEKPRVDMVRGTVELGDELIRKLKVAARARPRVNRLVPAAAAPSEATSGVLPTSTPTSATRRHVVAIGASTGGTEALVEVLARLPADCPPVLIVQHLPALFTAPLVARLDSRTVLKVREAADGDLILPGHVLVAPGDRHLEVARIGDKYVARLNSGPPVNRHRPSVDVLFDSCAREVGARAVGVVLTGMGADGAKGLLNLRRRGARTLVQDEATSVVFGMPKEAIALGAAETVLPLERIAAAIVR
jgi:two-component system chemotaxis response regulator CheB